MRFLNPKTDFAFKRIFGSAESPEVLLSFLNAILVLESPRRIVAVEILDPYLAPKIQGMKDTYLDVRARDEQGRQFIIEMQVLNVAGFEKRVLYNACKAYAGQIERGGAYGSLKEVIAITITDFMMFPDLPAVCNQFHLRAEDGQLYSEDLMLLFAELPKFTRGEGELVTALDLWFYFLKHAGDLKAVPRAVEREPAVVRAFGMANKAGMTPEELDDQERREIFIQDQLGALEHAETRGLRKGREEGREEGLTLGLEKGREEGLTQGLEKGREEERRRIARAMLDLVADDAVIARATGLSVEDVRGLR
jgi:predicted transposase/invertase (TIGR01784 family)